MDLNRFLGNLPPGSPPPPDLVRFAQYPPDVCVITAQFEVTDNGPFCARRWFADQEDLAARFAVFATDSGSLFALWVHDPAVRLDTAPIAFLSSNNRCNTVIANDVREFLSLLAHGSASFQDDVAAALRGQEWGGPKTNLKALAAFRAWAKAELGVEPAASPRAVITAAAKNHPDLAAWVESAVGAGFKPYSVRRAGPNCLPGADKLLDRFARHGHSHYHDGEAVFVRGHTVRLILSVEDSPPADYPAIVERARTTLARLRQTEPDIRLQVGRDMLDHYNTVYSMYPNEPLDAAGLAERIELRTITFHPDGAAELDYGTGDLFRDRMISVWEKDGEVSEAFLGD